MCGKIFQLKNYTIACISITLYSDLLHYLNNLSSSSSSSSSTSSLLLPLFESYHGLPSYFILHFTGCVHAAMDLFKYAYQLYPFLSSDLLRDCLTLAVTARKIDMRASPYDVSGVEGCAGKRNRGTIWLCVCVYVRVCVYMSGVCVCIRACVCFLQTFCIVIIH